MKKITFLIILGLLTGRVAKAQLVINELMQSNVDCIMDDLNDFPDSWVELYNMGTEAINLKDYSLGVTEHPNEAWQLQDTKIGVKQCVLVLNVIAPLCCWEGLRGGSALIPRRV